MSDGGHSGQCRCGAVRIEATGAPLATMACHCTGCQRMTGGAYSLSSFYPADRFAVINLKHYRIGDSLAEGPALKDVVPQGAVLEFHGTVFLLPTS